MTLIDWKSALEICVYDETVGIKIAKLNGNTQFGTYLTSIDPGKSVNPHYHKKGEEHYHIIEGSGEIELINVKTRIRTTTKVNKYSSFTVNPNTSHQLKNTGSEPLILMFSCPESHLNEDRFLMD
ncbi:MAG: cupin protein [Solimicrobium sp.]|jgi:mannose-6-phosphate isomerase-like protein (cupin superfamily)|nr:cupin protein [Solimicrobium sp.]